MTKGPLEIRCALKASFLLEERVGACPGEGFFFFFAFEAFSRGIFVVKMRIGVGIYIFAHF